MTLNFGRARRCFSENQRQEIATRHPRWVVGGCMVPIRECETTTRWPGKEGSETDVKGGVPLCRRKHHPQVTEGGYRLEPSRSGGYVLTAPPGAAELLPDRRRRYPSRSGP